MATKQIAVRLSADELSALRRLVPEGTDPARVRALIHSAAITDGIADRVASAVTKTVTTEGDMTRKVVRSLLPTLQQLQDHVLAAIHGRQP